MNRFLFEIEGQIKLNTAGLRRELDDITKAAREVIRPSGGRGSLAGVGGVGGSISKAGVQAEAELQREYRFGTVAKDQYIAGLKAITAEMTRAYATLRRAPGMGTPRVPSEAEHRAAVEERVARLDQIDARARTRAAQGSRRLGPVDDAGVIDPVTGRPFRVSERTSNVARLSRINQNLGSSAFDPYRRINEQIDKLFGPTAAPSLASATGNFTRFSGINDRVTQAFGSGLPTGASAEEREAIVALRNRTRALEAEAAALNRRTPEEVEAAAATRQTIKAEQRRQQVAEVAIRNEQYGPTSRTQQIEAWIRSRSGGAPVAAADQPKLGQLLGQSALTSARFAVSGGLAYGALTGIRATVAEVDKLDLSLAGVQDHLKAVNRGDEFATFRTEIIGISQDMGIAADQVANIAVQLQSAFGNNTVEAAQQTRDALKLAIVSGLPENEIADSLQAVVRDYHTTFTAIGDEAVGLQDRFGVAVKDTVQIFGDIAPSAKEAGLSLQQLGAIAGVVQRDTGLGAQGIAEGLNRVLANIQESGEKVSGIFASNPKTEGSALKIATLIGQGKTGEVLDLLVRSWDKLDGSQRKNLVTALGSQRNAKLLNALFIDSASYIAEVGRKQGDAGRLAQRYDQINQSVTRTLARLRQELLHIGIGLGDLGILDAAKIIGGGALLIVKSIGSIVDILDKLNSAAKGVPGALIGVAMAIRLASALGGNPAAAEGDVPIPGVKGGGGGPLGLARQYLTFRGLRQVVTGGAASAESIAGLSPEAAALLGARGSSIALSAPGAFLGRLAPAGFTEGTLAATAAGVGTLGVGTAAYLIGQKDLQIRRRIAKQSNAERAGLENYSLRDLQGATGTGGKSDFKSNILANPFSSGFRSFLGGTTTNKENVASVKADKTVAEFNAAAKAGLFNDIPPETLKRLQDNVNKSKGKGSAGRVAQALLSEINTKQYAQVQTLVKDANAAAADAKDPAGTANDVATTAAELAAAYQAGQITFQAYVDGMKKALARLDALAGGSDAAKLAALQGHQAFIQALDQERQRQVQADQAQVTVGLGVNPGQAATLAANITNARTALSSAQNEKDLPDKDHAKAVADAQIALNQALTAQVQYQQQTAGIIIQAKAQGSRDPIVKGLAAIQAAKAALANIDQKQDPNAWWQAWGALQAAEVQFQDDQTAITDARAALVQAQLAGDPVAAAAAHLKDAQHKLDLARSSKAGDAAIIAAQTEVTNAMRAAQDAIQQGIDNQFDLAIAVAEAAGQTVEAARDRVAKAQSDLDKAKARKDVGAIPGLEAALATAKASATDDEVSERRRQIDYRLQMGQITQGQAASLAKTLLTIPNLKPQVIDDINLYIKQLTDAAGKDLQFNLPSTINVGSLVYETRRLAGQGSFGVGPASAAGYQDNRVTSFVIQAADDPGATADAVMAKFNEQPRYSTYAGVYGGGGL